MKTIHVAVGSVNQTPLDWDGNLNRILSVIQESKAAGVQLLCLPELCVTGYGCEDAFLMPNAIERAEESLEEIVRQSEGIAICVGLPWRHHQALYNVAAFIANGALLGLVGKQHLAGDGLHYEPRWFSSWPEGEVVQTLCLEKKVMLGDLMVDLGGVRIGFEICEDAWSASRPSARQSAYGIDFILNPSASHFAFGKQALRERFINEGARFGNCAYLYANLLGNESGRVVFDGGALISNQGEIVASGKRFSFQDTTLTTAWVDIEQNRAKTATTASRKVIVKQPDGLISSSWQMQAQLTAACAPIEKEHWKKEEEFAHAVGLALFDYMRKSYSQGFVVSLSGGADSAAVSCLVAIGLRLAVQELGEEGVQERLSHIDLAADASQWMGQLLACVYQASEHSGKATHQSARELATSLGAEFQSWSIEELVQQYSTMVSQGLGRKLDWGVDDLAMQNIQARVRSPGIWMLANIRNALLLSTSNRSEASVGYATMDGDTSGGLSPVGGIDKAFLRSWLHWLEKVGSSSIETIPALSYVNQLQPTAELRPADQGQTDEGDLMPYPILDSIERAAIRDRCAPMAVSILLKNQYPEYESSKLNAWVVKFFRLWCRNQWKRERYAPSFHVDDESVDPKTWCRFPILSGSFKKELEELESLSK